MDELGFISFSSLLLLFLLLLFSLLSLLLFSPAIVVVAWRQLRQYLRRSCDCEICQTYLTSEWSKKFGNLCDWYCHLIKSSPTKTISIHVLGNIVTANPDNVEYILKTRFDNFPKGKPFSAILGDFLGDGIFNVDGDKWRFQRKLACLELDSRSMASFAFDVVAAEIQTRLLPLLSSSSAAAPLDLQEVFRHFAFCTICRFSFGTDPAGLPEFAAAFDLASSLSAERAMTSSPAVWRIKRLLNVGSERRLRGAIAAVDSLAREVIARKRKFGAGPGTHRDLLSRFMATIPNDDTLLRDIVISFILAGRDTIASALTSFFWLMVKNPKTESLIRAEADRVLGPSRGPKSLEQVKELHYLQAAILETMRLFPPIQIDSKFCLSDDVLPDGTFVKSGTRVTYHAYAMGRAEEIWGPDWAEFRPERWLSGSPVSAFKYPVFQAGFRVCLGKEMAMVELKCVALAVVRRFRFQLAQACPHINSPRFSPGLTATFSGGLPVVVKQVRNHLFELHVIHEMAI